MELDYPKETLFELAVFIGAPLVIFSPALSLYAFNILTGIKPPEVLIGISLLCIPGIPLVGYIALDPFNPAH